MSRSSRKSKAKRPRPLTLWEKVDPSVLLSPGESSGGPEKQELTVAEKRRRRIKYGALDFVGSAFWLYQIIRTFIFDIDRWALESIDPALSVLLDYRLLLYLALVASAVIVSAKSNKRKRAIALGFLYVAGYPLVVLCWKIPKFVFARKSWIVTLSALNAAVAVAANYQFYIVVYAVGSQAMIVILAAESRSVLIAEAAIIAVLTFALIYRAARAAFKPSMFLKLQRAGAVSLMATIRPYVALQPELKDSQIRKFSKEQLELLRDRLALGLCVVQSANFWVHQLEKYRRSKITHLYAALSYVALFVQVLVGFTNRLVGTGSAVGVTAACVSCGLPSGDARGFPAFDAL